jgi:hypothetical protein
MPIQDNEDKRVPDQPVPDAEEELRRRQAQEQQQNENSIQKSGKLLPFLNAKAEYHQSRIDSLDEKIANQTDKIDRNNAKIEALSAKADKLEDTNRMLKATFANMPLVQSMIRKNEERIKAIREDKIPKRQQKSKAGWQKIDKLTAKRAVISHKFDRVVALNDAIRSFSIGFNKERREVFADAMDRLNEATYHCITDKKQTLDAQKQELIKQYNAPETSAVDKFDIQSKINEMTARIQKLDERLEKVWQPDEFYVSQDNDTLDAQMELTSEKLADIADNGIKSTSELAEDTLFSALETEELDKAQVAALADKFNHKPTADVEVQLEDDYNMIDGIINNGSKEDIDKAKTELSDTIKSMESLAENPYVPQEMRDNAAAELVKLKKQMELLADSDEVFVESWLSEMLEDGTAELTENGGFKVNADYYFELPRNERHYETMTEAQAATVMSALTASAVEFSAMSKGEDKVSITVAKKDVPILNDLMYSAIGKVAKTEAAKENAGKGDKGKHQTINPEYYASLSEKERFTKAEPVKTAQAITAELEKTGVPFSAVVRKNDTMAITVRKENAPVYKKIEGDVKASLAKERVPLSPEKAQAKQQPKRSAPPQRKGTGYFSRKEMQKEAQRVRQQGKKQDTPAPAKKKDNQGLE